MAKEYTVSLKAIAPPVEGGDSSGVGGIGGASPVSQMKAVIPSAKGGQAQKPISFTELVLANKIGSKSFDPLRAPKALYAAHTKLLQDKEKEIAKTVKDLTAEISRLDNAIKEFKNVFKDGNVTVTATSNKKKSLEAHLVNAKRSADIHKKAADKWDSIINPDKRGIASIKKGNIWGGVKELFKDNIAASTRNIRATASAALKDPSKVGGLIGRLAQNPIGKLAVGRLATGGGAKIAGTLMGAAKIAGPIVAAVAIVATALLKLGDKLKEFSPAMAGAMLPYEADKTRFGMRLGDALAPLLDGLTNILSGLFDIVVTLVEALKPVFQILGAVLHSVGGILKIIASLLKLILLPMEIVAAMFEPLIDGMSEMTDAITDWVDEIVGEIRGLFVGNNGTKTPFLTGLAAVAGGVMPNGQPITPIDAVGGQRQGGALQSFRDLIESVNATAIRGLDTLKEFITGKPAVGAGAGFPNIPPAPNIKNIIMNNQLTATISDKEAVQRAIDMFRQQMLHDLNKSKSETEMLMSEFSGLNYMGIL